MYVGAEIVSYDVLQIDRSVVCREGTEREIERAKAPSLEAEKAQSCSLAGGERGAINLLVFCRLRLIIYLFVLPVFPFRVAGRGRVWLPPVSVAGDDVGHAVAGVSGARRTGSGGRHCALPPLLSAQT